MNDDERRSYVIVSPHPDDAALSCGGMLGAQGHATRVVTVCAGVPPEDVAASHWDRRCGFTHARTAALVRREEDLRACASVGARAIHLPWYDRQYADIASPHGSAPSDLVASLLPLLEGAEVWLPAAIGAHPDHVMVRDAGLRAVGQLGVPAHLYADAPYAGDSSERGGHDAPERGWPALDAVASVGFTVSAPRQRQLSPAETAAKIALARFYASQLCSLGALYPRLTHLDGDLAVEIWWDLSATA